MPSPTTLSNQTVMIQIRRNLVDRMLGELEQGRGNAAEFFRFISLEPVDLNWDIYERLTRIAPLNIGLSRQPTFRINPHVHEPQWRGLKHLLPYLKERINHHFEKMVIRLLSHHLVIEQKVQTTALYQKTLDQFKGPI